MDLLTTDGKLPAVLTVVNYTYPKLRRMASQLQV
jgi:hypothetical protein